MAGTHDLSRDPIPVPRKLTFVCTSEADAKPLPPGASRRVGREEDKAVFEVEVDMSGVATFGDGCKLALNEIVGIGNHDGVAVKPTVRFFIFGDPLLNASLGELCLASSSARLPTLDKLVGSERQKQANSLSHNGVLSSPKRFFDEKWSIAESFCFFNFD